MTPSQLSAALRKLARAIDEVPEIAEALELEKPNKEVKPRIPASAYRAGDNIIEYIERKYPGIQKAAVEKALNAYHAWLPNGKYGESRRTVAGWDRVLMNNRVLDEALRRAYKPLAANYEKLIQILLTGEQIEYTGSPEQDQLLRSGRAVRSFGMIKLPQDV